MKTQESVVESSTIDYYNAHARKYFLQSVNADMHSLYQNFLQFIPKGGTILDAGCGSGRDAKYFSSLGYDVTAIDASEEMVRISTQFSGKQTILMEFRDINFQNIFDGVWSIASLLHIPRGEIEAVLKRFTLALKVDGIWCISFKEGDSERVEDGRFFNDYNKQTFTTLIENHPLLHIEDLWYSIDCMGRRQKWTTALLRKNRN